MPGRIVDIEELILSEVEETSKGRIVSEDELDFGLESQVESTSPTLSNADLELEDDSLKSQFKFDKNLLSLEDEDVVAKLKADLGESFDISEAIFAPGGFSGVNIKTKDGKKSIKIETNINTGFGGLGGANVERAVTKFNEQGLSSLTSQERNLLGVYQQTQKDADKAINDLNNFLNDNKTKEVKSAVKKQNQEIKRATNKLNNIINPDVEAIEKEFSLEENPNMFKKVTKTVKVGGYTSPTTGISTSGSYKEVTTQPYEKELKQAAESIYGKDWPKRGMDIDMEKVEAEAREIVIENKRVAIKEQKQAEILENMEGNWFGIGKELPATLAYFEGKEDVLKQMLTTGTERQAISLVAKKEVYEQKLNELKDNKEIDEFIALKNKIESPDYEFDSQEGEELVTLTNGKTMPKAIFNDLQSRRAKLKPKFDSLFNLQNDLIDNRYNLQDAPMVLDMLRRDYNDTEKLGATIAIGFGSLFNNINGLTENVQKHKNWSRNKEALQAYTDKYSKPIAFDDAFSNGTNFGKFVLQEVGNQIPIFASLAVPYVGWGTLLASTGGEQYGDMTAEQIAGLKDYSTWEKVYTSAGYAIPELAFELATTVPLLRGAGAAMKGLYGNSFRELVQVGGKQFVKENAPAFIRGATLESLGEGATTVTQNLVTGRPWHENVDHSMFSGLMFGTTLAGVPLVSGAIKSQLGDYKSSEDFRNNLKETNKLQQDNKNLDTKISLLEGKATPENVSRIEQAEKDKARNKEKIDELSQANEKILKEQNESIIGKWTGWGQINKNGMSAGAMQGYLKITTQQEQLRIEAERISNDKTFEEQERAKRLKDLYNDGMTDSNGNKIYGFGTLQNIRDAFRDQKNSEFNLWTGDKNNKADYDKLLQEADNYLNNLNNSKTPSWVRSLKTGQNDREDVARIIWNTQQINKNIKNGDKTKLGRSLVKFETVDDAVAAMEKDPDNFSTDLIKAVKDGVHGFDGIKNQSYVIVENMAKDDRLETKTHELSHRFLTNAVKGDPQAFKEISETILDWAKENDIKLYNRLATNVDSAPDEILAVFLEEAAAERIDLSKKGIAGVIGYMTGNIMKDDYGVDMDFAGESDVIKMLIGLGKKLKAGKLTLKDQAAFIKSMRLEKAQRQGEAITMLQDLGVLPNGAIKLSQNAEGSQTTVKSDLFKETNDALVDALELYGIENPQRLLSEDIEVRKELAKEWEALGDSKFWIGSIIGEKWKKFLEVNYLSKRDKAANYELYKDQILDVAATGIEKGDNGIPFLVRSWKPAEEGGRTLTSHIFGEIETRLMAKGGIIDRKFPQFDKFTSSIDMSRDDGGIDVEGDLGIEAVLAAEKRKKERKENLEEDRYRKLIGVDNKLATEIKNEIQEVLLSGDLGLISEFDWTQRFSKSAQKKLFTLIKKQMKDYDTFLKKTRLPFIKHAHTSDLVQMEKMEGKKILAKLKSENSSPTKIKLGFLEGLIQPFEVKSMTSGPNIYDKLTPTPQEFIDFMRVRGRKDAYVKNNINIMAMDAVFDVLLNQTVEVDGEQVRVLDQFIKQQQDLGLPSTSNVLSIIKERINRDQDVKFSKTVRDFNSSQMVIFYDSLSTLGDRIDLINVGDESAMKTLVDEVYGGFLIDGKAVFTKTQLKSLSNDLFKLVKQYAVIDKNHTNLKTKPKETLNKYLYNEIDAGVLQETLKDVLGIDDNLAIAFDNTTRIKNQRAAIVDLGKSFIKTYGREQALMMMIHAGGMYSTSTQISRGNHVVKNGKVVKITKDQITKVSGKTGKVKTEFSTQRYQSFEGKKDWNTNVLKKLFPELQLTKADNLTKIQTLNGVLDDRGKPKNIDTSLLSESSEKGMQDKNFVAREAQAKLSEIIVKDLAQYYKDKISDSKLDKVDFGMLMMSMASNMQSPLKRAANLKYIYKDKAGKKYKGKLRYEHMIPTNFMVLSITDAYMSENSDIDLDALFKEYTVAIIPVAMDDIFEEMGMVYTMPFGYDGKQTSRVRYYNMKTFGHPDLYAIESIDPKDKGKIYGEEVANIKFSRNIDKSNKLNTAIVQGRKTIKESQGITVLDFDDTLATTESLVKFTRPNGTTGTLNAEEYASTYEDLLDQGFTFDFSDFNKVVKGKLAPLFNKAIKLQGKFGPENMFVLTARPPQAAKAIFDFLKANGLNIPIKNITGLGDSTAEAKALWVADKVGEGYNDFYFADDALQNVQAVDNMLNQFDVKRKVQQAKVKFSKGMSDQFNDIIENVTGIETQKRFSDVKARKRGESKGKFRVFIPPSHEDFVGLLYNFMGKGKEGNAHRNFFEQALVRPLNRAYREIDTAKQAIANDYKSLNKQFPNVKDKLIKNTPNGDFTFQDAIRVYLWNKHGYTIPGLAPTDQKNLVDIVTRDTELQAYAETLNVISKQETYVDPGPSWETGNIRIDLIDATGRVGRKEYFAEFNENAEVLFSSENLNKIEAAYGKDFRSALEDMLHRIKTGVNRPKGASAKPNMFMNWLNASVSGVMFFNTRSALLQQMSNVNYLNFADNNILAAGKAFANQPQYWKDFAMIFNSDMLKQRRGGLQTDINGAELAEAIKKARPDNMFDQVSIIVGKALRLGFLPTQIGDNIAIATGGAAFYRNRVNKYIKEGMSVKEAEAAAFTDFQNITQSTQQSARPDMTSQQQAMWIGKLVLNFLNTPSQYNRIIKKAGSDIINRRITPPNTTQMQSDMSNMSRILYYGAAQNLIFYSLQTALFAVMFGTDDEDDDKRAEQFLKKKERVINGSIDTILRGSGIYGVAVSTLKNMVIKFLEQRDPTKYNKDESAVLMELANFSPVLGIKFRRIVNAEKTLNYNVGVMNEMETFDVDNPQWSAATNYIQALTTAPVNKMYQKSINLRNAADNDYTALQRALFFSGYTTWSLNLGDTEKMENIKESVKSKKKSKKKSKTRSRIRTDVYR